MRGALGSSPVYLGREMVLFFRVFLGGLIRFIFFYYYYCGSFPQIIWIYVHYDK